MNQEKRIYFDGGMGTQIYARGGSGGRLNEVLNLEEEQLVFEIHRAYSDAGCNIIKTNTFGANRFKLAGSGYTVEQVVTKAVQLAKKAGGGKRVAMDIGPTGKMLQPLGDLAFEDAVAVFGEMAEAGEAAGADLVLIETMSDLYELKAAVLGAKERTRLPVWATVTVDQGGRLLTGGDLAGVFSTLKGLGAEAMGLNCGLSCGQVKALIPQLMEFCGGPLILNPNAGLPQADGDRVYYDMTPEKFACEMAAIAGQCGQVLGGCCGTTPEHIRLLIEQTKELPFTPGVNRDLKIPCSYRMSKPRRADGPVVIAQISADAAADAKGGDYYGMVDDGIDAQSAGADLLYLGPWQEGMDYAEAVQTVQASVTLPLMLDGGHPDQLAHALRVYNGRPLVWQPAAEAQACMRKYGGIPCEHCAVLDQAQALSGLEEDYVLCRFPIDDLEEIL